MFKSNPDGSYVPTKSVSVKPESQIDYGPNEQFKFLLPQFLGFMDTNESYMQFDLQMQGIGYARPDPKAAAHALFRRFRLMDGAGMATLEEVEAYNVLQANLMEMNSNNAIRENRGQFMGRSANANPAHQLYYSPLGDWTAGTITSNPAPLKVKVNVALNSGILSSGKVFPLQAARGLRLEVDTEDQQVALFTPSALQRGVNIINAFQTDREKGPSAAAAANKDEKAAIDSTFTMGVKANADNIPANNGEPDTKPNPYMIGDMLYIAKADETAEETLGVITAFSKDGSSNGLLITYIPNRANATGLATDFPADSLIYAKTADRVRVLTYPDVPATSAAGVAINSIGAVNYNISDLEYVISQVSPPPAYVSRMMSQLNSSQGLNLDVKSYTLYRNNVFDANGISQMLIPARETRAYSILSYPNLVRSSDVFQSDLTTSFDGAGNYNYVIGGKLVPDRKVSLKRYSQTPEKSEALHLIETEKAVSNCGNPVRELRNLWQRAMVGRAFSKYGQVFNTAKQDLQLRIDYDSSSAAKLVHNYICHLRRIRMSNENVEVIV